MEDFVINIYKRTVTELDKDCILNGVIIRFTLTINQLAISTKLLFIITKQN